MGVAVGKTVGYYSGATLARICHEEVPFLMHDTLLLSAAGCYLAAVVVLYRSLTRVPPSPAMVAVALTTLGVILHASAQAGHWFTGGPPEISFLNALSLCGLVVVTLLLASVPLRDNVFDAGLIALPLAAIVLLGEWWLDAPGSLLDAGTATTHWHVVSSVLAFGVLSIAGVYAVFVALIDHFLRKHHVNPLVRALPALDTLERLLFRLISVGLVLLTVSLTTGLLFVNDLFGQHLVHKTVLSMVAWLVFAVLLWGRRFRGWRGRRAVRLTILGIVLLALGYFGAKAVLEVLLDRDWQA